MRVEGPLIVAQLLETTLLTLVNFARYVTSTLLSSGEKKLVKKKFVIFIVISISLVWSQQMQQDTALRPGARERFSFWSSDFAEPKGQMVDYRLPSMPMLVSKFNLPNYLVID